MSVSFLRSLTVLAATVLVLVALPARSLAQAPTDPLPLTDLRFEGLQRYAHADVVRLSGIVIGQPVSPVRLTEIAQQLADTGLFTAIRYRYTTSKAGLAAQFDVTEAAWNVPVVFDNFLSVPDDDLIAAVAKYVPGFDGTAVEGGRANNFIGTALQRVLADRGDPGTVVVIPRVNVESGESVFAFAVTDTGADMTLCAIRIPGADAVNERDLSALGADLLGRLYSRSTLELFASGTLRQYYRQRGFWAATFETPSGALNQGCDGVTAAIGVSEGIPYRWAGATWSGVSGMPEADLDQALDMKTGAVADVLKLEEGLRNVKTAYEKLGFVLQTQSVEPVLDATTRDATFAIAVSEGPQFRMGTFTIEGLPERNVAELTSRWKLKSGDLFDASYVRTFLIEQRARIQLDDGPFMMPDISLNERARIADVALRPASTVDQ